MERTDDMLSIFLEYVPGGTIATMIKKNGPLGESTMRSLSRQICDGLSYLHRSHIIHRDIKAANILVDNMGMAKLADFGASKRIADVLRESLGGCGAQSLVGTPYMMAPEVIRQTGHDYKVCYCYVGAIASTESRVRRLHRPISGRLGVASSKWGPANLRGTSIRIRCLQ
jgi:serine/threonine protein kinase